MGLVNWPTLLLNIEKLTCKFYGKLLFDIRNSNKIGAAAKILCNHKGGRYVGASDFDFALYRDEMGTCIVGLREN